MKRLVCMVLAWMLVCSLAPFSYAQGVDADIFEALKSQLASERNTRMEEENILLHELLVDKKQGNPVIIHLLYDSEGNLVVDPSLILCLSESESASFIARGPVAQTCCENPSQTVFYDEWHLYQPPTPAWCTYERIEILLCKNCITVYSRTNLGEILHVHR